MLRSGLLFSLLKKKPNILIKQKQLFRFTFLQSQHFHQQLALNPLADSNQQIKELLQTPFHSADLQNASFLKLKADQHESISQRIYNSLRKEKDKIVENVAELSQRNIIDTKIWSKVFAETTQLRFAEIYNYPGVQSLFSNMQNYLSKFNPQLYKFTLDQVEMMGLFSLREKSYEVIVKRDKISDLKVQNKIISLYSTAGDKLDVGLKSIREYYFQNVVKNIQVIFEKQNNVVQLTELQTLLDPLHYAKKRIRKNFTEKLEKIYETQKVDIKEEDYLTMAKNWATFGKVRECFSSLFSKVFDALVQDYPVMMLQILVCSHIEQSEKIQRCLKVLQSIDYQQLSQKPKIHLLLHILSIRQYDLKTHYRLVKNVCKDSCQKLRYDVSEAIRSPVSSECMTVDRETKGRHYPPQTLKWISNTLKEQVTPFENQNIFYFTKICQYFVIFGVIKNKKVYVVNFSDLHLALNKLKQSRSMIKIQQQIFEHYGIQTLQLKKTSKYIRPEINKSNKKMLVDAVEDLLTNI